MASETTTEGFDRLNWQILVSFARIKHTEEEPVLDYFRDASIRSADDHIRAMEEFIKEIRDSRVGVYSKTAPYQAAVSEWQHKAAALLPETAKEAP